MYQMNRFCFFLASCFSMGFLQGLTPTPIQDITPVPMDRFNPQLTEFRRMDTSGDEKVTFTEFLLSDKDYIEARSREFHSYDKNKDGMVSRAEWEAYFEREGRDHSHLPHSHHGPPDLEHDSFFGGGLGGRSPFHHFFNSPIRHELRSEHEGQQKGGDNTARPSPNGGQSSPFYRRLKPQLKNGPNNRRDAENPNE